jgi:hypothetical protein
VGDQSIAYFFDVARVARRLFTWVSSDTIFRSQRVDDSALAHLERGAGAQADREAECKDAFE